jgi:hypothetical protein
MSAMNREQEKPSFLPPVWLPVLLIAAATAWRVMKLDAGAEDRWPNIAPWMALAFTGAIVLPRAIAWWVWPVLLLAVDLIARGSVVLSYLDQVWPVYLCFAVAAIWGGSLRGKLGIAGTLLSVVTCSLGFYLITNTAAWAVSTAYAKDLSGWVQALTTGTPGFPPTYLFLRNSLLSDIGFSVLLLLAYNAEAFMRNLVRIPVFIGRETAAA